jgi:hypothetical protein
MTTVVGIFERRSDAERAVNQLESIGIPKAKINTLTPELSTEERAAVPKTTGEQPGIVKGISAVTGGAIGMSAASLLIPGIGPILGIGLAGGALLGSLTGAAIGGKLEDSIFPGIPEQELFIYEDALRKGRTAIIAMAEDDAQAGAARGVLQYAGAESIDEARQMWWVGIRDIEKEKYGTGGDFEKEEAHFRRGFETALNPRNRDKVFDEYRRQAPETEAAQQERAAFQRGYERGRQYLQARREAIKQQMKQAS